MQVTISFDKESAQLGQPITVTYSSEGFQTVTIQLDNMTNPLVFSGDVEGSFKTLPIIDGAFTALITGTGRAIYDNTDAASLTATAVCIVS